MWSSSLQKSEKTSKSEKYSQINVAHPHLYTTANSLCVLSRNCIKSLRAALHTLQKSGSMSIPSFPPRMSPQPPRAQVMYSPCPSPLQNHPWPHLVNGHAVHIGVIHKPDDLVGEELAVVLGGKVRFCGLRRVQLQPLADSFSQHVQRGICFHNFGHGLLDQRFAPREPVPISAEEENKQKTWLLRCCLFISEETTATPKSFHSAARHLSAC